MSMRYASLLTWSLWLLVAALLAPAVEAQAPAAKTATQFYMEYRAAFDKAKKVEELFPYLSADHRKEIEATPAAERPKMFQFLKMISAMTNVKVIREDRSSTGATLTAEGVADGKKQTGKIEIIREGTAWKVGKENWSGSM
jgi:hypothetical protein